MAIVLLVRHGRTTANADGTLAGRTPGVYLDEQGLHQVQRAGERLAAVPLRQIVFSPLERCRETAEAIVEQQPGQTPAIEEPGLLECDYGDWQGRPLKELAEEPLWRTVQRQPAAAAFPQGESLAAMHARSVAAIRRWDALVEAEHGPTAVWAAVFHGDPIKAVLADALGLHLDLFQRLHADPASISIVGYGADRPSVIATNTTAGDLSWLAAAAPAGDAAVGGGAGPRAAAGEGS